MTVSLQPLTVISSIAGLTVSLAQPANGYTNLGIFDITGLKDEYLTDVTRRGPILVPKPIDFMKLDKLTLDSLSSGPSAQKTIYYSLGYRLFYAATGSGRGYWDIYPYAVQQVINIWNVIIANDTVAGCVNLWPMGSINIRALADASDNKFYGCDLTFQVKEFIN
jgi:hypothetical protein